MAAPDCANASHHQLQHKDLHTSVTTDQNSAASNKGEFILQAERISYSIMDKIECKFHFLRYFHLSPHALNHSLRKLNSTLGNKCLEYIVLASSSKIIMDYFYFQNHYIHQLDLWKDQEIFYKFCVMNFLVGEFQ